MYGPCFSSIVGGHPLRPPTRLRLGRPLPYQLADGPQTPPEVNFSFTLASLTHKSLCGISSPFELLSPASGQIIHVLLTRSPLTSRSKSQRPSDLHVLGTPPAFILSQDQTLHMFPSLSSSVSSSSFVFASLSEARLLLRRSFLGSVYCQYSVVKVLSCQCAPEIKTRSFSQQVSFLRCAGPFLSDPLFVITIVITFTCCY
jgi:hypothetical protein